MSSLITLGNFSSSKTPSSTLRTELEKVLERCTNCEACQKDCQFLKKYGKPKEIAEAYNLSDKTHQAMPFECSLCQLCASVCPEKINPAGMFLEMRREKVRRSHTDYPEHAGIIAYERRGTSRRYTCYALPLGCDTVFFPGCNLPGSRPNTTFKLYEHMNTAIPALGIVLDCCMKISHDLGRTGYFTAMFREMNNFLTGNGIRNVIVACPNCHRMFKEHGENLSVETVYEVLAANGLPHEESVQGVVTIHDPCAVRFEKATHSAVRHLVTKQGLTIEEMPHHRERTLCCGEGGFAGCISPDFAGAWGTAIKGEADGRRIITYCAGCTNHLNRVIPASHFLDLLFEPKATLAGKAKVSRAPMTYINRLRLKHRFRKSLGAGVTRDRISIAGEEKKGEIWVKATFRKENR